MKLAKVALLSALFTIPAFGDNNWGQWRGPNGTGAVADANPPTEWSETKNVKWKVKLPGAGHSTPVIWGDRIYVQTAIPKGNVAEAAPLPPASNVLGADAQPGRGGRGGRGGGGGGRGGFGGGGPPAVPYEFAVMCLDRKTGNTIWKKVAREEQPHEGAHRDHGYSSYSAATDGSVVVAYFGSRGLHVYDMDGNPKWNKDLGKMQTKMSFGEGSSPALYKDTVIVNWDHEGADFIAAFDKNSGNELWRTPRDEGTTWSTPLVVEHDGKAQVIVNATGKIRAYDVATGKEIWSCGGMTANAIPTPVAADGVVYVTSGFRGSACLAIKLGRTGDLTGTDAILWKIDRQTPYVPSPLLSGPYLYFFGVNSNMLSCVDAKTGKHVFGPERVEGLQNVYASPVSAGDKIYLIARDGAAVVIKRSDKLEVLATNKLNEGIDASPAVAGDELFLRGREHLYCISAAK